jgi:hypothetical protein
MVVLVNPEDVSLPPTVVADNCDVTLISFHEVATGLVVPVDTFCAIIFNPVAVNPLGDV